MQLRSRPARAHLEEYIAPTAVERGSSEVRGYEDMRRARLLPPYQSLYFAFALADGGRGGCRLLLRTGRTAAQVRARQRHYSWGCCGEDPDSI